MALPRLRFPDIRQPQNAIVKDAAAKLMYIVVLKPDVITLANLRSALRRSSSRPRTVPVKTGSRVF